MEGDAGMEEDTDSLVRRVLEGQVEAFAEIVRRYQQPVWRTVAALLQDFDKSTEIAQQVFVDAYLHLDQYRPGADFGAWIKAVARNRVRQELRRLGRETRRLSLYRDQLLRRLHERETDSHEQTYLDALETCRRHLPETSARALRLRYVEGLSFEEIASILGSTRAAVEKLLSRARLALRDCIQSKVAHA
ncbi:MAG TPA: sigma-70 family RNA polymerase sigma factor [Planctomycetota bacterium]|nr:sigma-70 family RNA polymerase sigma factor [Planctomycetota bacterium]